MHDKTNSPACYYRRMYRIRKFEETILHMFSENKLKGTTHTSIGQEADAVAVMSHVTEDDYVFSNHRCHGQFIEYSNDIKALLSEIMGKSAGMCRGRGGSQHICYKHFYTNGVQGGIVPNAVGLALALKMKADSSKTQKRGITVVFLGDGTLGQGVVYESFNLAALYDVPILFVIEDNGYAMSTKTSDAVAGAIIDRPAAFGIACSETDTNDVEKLDAILGEAFDYVRRKRKPYCQVIHTYRLGPHSKGDDCRALDEIEKWKKKDPMFIAEKRLDEAVAKSIRREIDAEIEDAIAYAEGQDVNSDTGIYDENFIPEMSRDSLLSTSDARILDAVNGGLKDAISNDKEVVLIGEDIRDPYGGAFKVTKGLSSTYPEQVINTPISEAGFIGLCIGMAMGGLKPVAEIMFGDFISLAFDQLLNHASKYEWMYAGQVKIPMLIRVPGGAGGYGPTHSQSLEKYLIGIPNLRVLAISRLINVSGLLNRIMDNLQSPIILIENKKMYGLRAFDVQNGRYDIFEIDESRTEFPVICAAPRKDIKADAVIITYGGMVDIALEASKQLLVEDELVVNVIVETSISPIDYNHTIEFIGEAEHVFTLEEGNLRNGWGSEIVSGLSERTERIRFQRIAAKNCVIPCGYELEEKVIPQLSDVVGIIRGLI